MVSAMNTYYTILNITPGASQEEIEHAYTHQRERYRPERVAALDEEMQGIAMQRTEELERAYQVLSDPVQRQQYDVSIGIGSPDATPPPPPPPPQPTRLAPGKEYRIALGGVGLSLVLIVVIWLVVGGQGSTTPVAPEARRPAPDFTLPAPDGGEVRLADYQGKIILVNFWGSWCGPCVHEIPELQAAHEQLRDQGLVVIGVNLFDNEVDKDGQKRTAEDIRQFVETLGVTYPIALDVRGEVSRAYRVYPIPTSFFIDRQGTIRYMLPREITADEIAAWFTQLNQEAARSAERDKVRNP
jgi:peroxiredoxin